MGSTERRLSVYLQTELLPKLSNLLFWFHGSSRYRPRNLGFLQLHRAARFATAEYCSHEKTILLKHLQVLGPFALRFSTFFPLGNWITENQCQSVCLCVLNILQYGVTDLCRSSCVETHTSLLTLVTLVNAGGPGETCCDGPWLQGVMKQPASECGSSGHHFPSQRCAQNSLIFDSIRLASSFSRIVASNSSACNFR